MLLASPAPEKPFFRLRDMRDLRNHTYFFMLKTGCSSSQEPARLR